MTSYYSKQQEYQDDFEDDNDGGFEKDDEPAPKPPAPQQSSRKMSPKADQISKKTSSDSYESERQLDSRESRDSRKFGRSDPEPKQSNYSKPQPSIGLNFKAAVQRTSKLSRRANDLLRLVTFDVTR